MTNLSNNRNNLNDEEIFNNIYKLSNIINTNLDEDSLAICYQLIKNGINPDALIKFDKNDLQHIYEPSEDTFLFMDALELEKSFIKTLEPTIILEIGSGSGVLTTFLALNFDLDNTHFMATDINPLACVKTSETIHLNYSQLPLKVKRPKVSIFIDDLAQSIIDRLNYNIDMIIFNPPYVPTHDITDNGQSGDLGQVD
ncbi:unnamed protein product [Gordionus sp. m RMFG-2023]